MDVGANVGDTAVLMRGFGNWPIVCVEGDPLFLRYLRVNAQGLADIKIARAFANSGIPSFNGSVRSAGSARLVTRRWPARELVSIRGLGEIHDEYGGGERCSLVKLDTDGLDLLILRHSHHWLACERPVLFLEYDPTLLKHYSDAAASDLLTSLAECGYGQIAAFTNLGAPFGAYALDARGVTMLNSDLLSSGAAFLDLAVFPLEGEAKDLKEFMERPVPSPESLCPPDA
jgi:FkbM family methyltransferase